MAMPDLEKIQNNNTNNSIFTFGIISGIDDRKGIKEALCKTSLLNEVSLTEEEIPNTVTFLGGNDKFYLVINTTINVDEEKGRLVKEIEYYQKFISSVENKLSNEKFANSAPADIVNKEKQKLADGQTKLKGLMEALTKLG